MGRATRCGNCGSDLPDDSIYCLVCGKRVGDEQTDAVSYASLPFGTIVECPKCGGRNSRTERWCTHCDADLDDAKKRSAPPVSKGTDCPRCGARCTSGSNYCRRCGASFNPASQDRLSGLSLASGNSLPGIILGGPEMTHQHEIIRERQVIMVRCKYCGTLNGPEAQKCSSCGGQM